MMKLERPEKVPECINGNEQRLGNNYRDRKIANPSFSFNWGNYQKKPRNHALLIELKLMSAEHCSFCDGFPFEMSKETIEHFRPKSLFPELAYTWSNLFLACDRCQSEKGESFNALLLKPDDPEYRFSRYFMVNYLTGELLPNAAATEEDKQAARITIDMYNLDAPERRISRRRTFKEINAELKEKGELTKDFIDTINYRYLTIDIP